MTEIPFISLSPPLLFFFFTIKQSVLAGSSDSKANLRTKEPCELTQTEISDKIKPLLMANFCVIG